MGGWWPPASRRSWILFLHALTACKRKLLVVLNSMLRHSTRWRDPLPVLLQRS